MSGGGSGFLVQEGTAAHFQRVISPRVTAEQAMAQRNDAASLHGYHQIKVERGGGGMVGVVDWARTTFRSHRHPPPQ